MHFRNLLTGLILNVLVFNGQNLSGQSLTLSNEINMVSDNNYDLIGYFNNKITLLEDDGRSITLHEFDDNLKSLNAPVIGNNNKKSRLIGYVPQDTMLTLYYRYTEEGKYLLSLVNYNAGLQDIDGMVLQEYDKNQHRVLPINVSEDKSYHLIMFDEGSARTTRYMM